MVIRMPEAYSPWLSFRGEAEGREPGIHNPGLWLWIPGSLATLGPRNDAGGVGGRSCGSGAWSGGPPSLAPQIPKHAGDDQAGADEDEGIERLVVEPPADHRDQRDAQEVERHHDARIAGLKGVGQAVVRGEPRDA